MFSSTELLSFLSTILPPRPAITLPTILWFLHSSPLNLLHNFPHTTDLFAHLTHGCISLIIALFFLLFSIFHVSQIVIALLHLFFILLSSVNLLNHKCHPALFSFGLFWRDWYLKTLDYELHSAIIQILGKGLFYSHYVYITHTKINY